MKAEEAEAWAWKVKVGKGWWLCLYAEPTKEMLLKRGGKPSPEARAVKVVMKEATP